MNHLLFGFALCAALVIYPGGLAIVAASFAASAGRLLIRSPSPPDWIAAAVERPWSSLLGLALAGLVLAPIPWPDNPVAPVGISWASGSNLGGISLSLGGLWALQLLGSGQPRRGWVLIYLGAWSLGLVLLASAVHSGNWSGVLTAGGPGAEVGRVGLALVGAGALPWVLGAPPGGLSATGAAWAASSGMVLILALPQLQAVPFPVAIAAWWALLALLGFGWAGASGWRSRIARRRRLNASAATLNTP